MRATLRSLTETGFAGTTMAGIARDAGVSTATLYRRYSSLTEVVVAALSDRAERHPVPDTGTLQTDLQAYLRTLARQLIDRRGARLLVAVIDEASRNDELAQAVYRSISAPARRGIATMFERAIERGEMRDDIDLELAIDLAAGPLYLRRLEAVRTIESDLPDQIAELVIRAVQPYATSADP